MGHNGLSSKECTPTMLKCVFENISQEEPKHPLTTGINDDLTNTSLGFRPNFDIELDGIKRAIF